MVLDRLFLWIFATASVVGTWVILCEAPSFCGDNNPSIDMEHSFVPQQQYLPDPENVMQNPI